jgi:hypothetical protein
VIEKLVSGDMLRHNNKRINIGTCPDIIISYVKARETNTRGNGIPGP